MPSVDLVDETFIAAAPARIASVVADRRRWEQWWPDLRLTVFMDRGHKGIRWSVAGRFVGSAEIWIEPAFDGAIVHYYLRLDPTPTVVDVTTDRTSPSAVSARSTSKVSNHQAARIRGRRAKSWKRIVWALKDELESGREPGMPATTPDAATSARSGPVEVGQ